MTWEKCFSGEGWFITYDQLIKEATDFDKKLIQKILFATEKQALSAIAKARLSHIIAKANGDWVADWEQVLQDKYSIGRRRNKIVVLNEYNTDYEFLAFKDSETRDRVLEQNEELIKQYFEL